MTASFRSKEREDPDTTQRETNQYMATANINVHPNSLTTIEQHPPNQRMYIGSIRSSEKKFTGAQMFEDSERLQ